MQSVWKWSQPSSASNAPSRSHCWNLLRRFYLKVYCFENALLEESVPGGGDPARTPECMKGLLRGDTPDSFDAARLQLLARAVFLLNEGDYAGAKRLLTRAFGDDLEFWGDEKVDLFLFATVAHRGLGEEKEAQRHLENAFLTIPALENTFSMGHYAAKASGLLRVWGRETEAREWDAFIGQLKIPEKTAGLFRERTARIVERTRNRERVFLC